MTLIFCGIFASQVLPGTTIPADTSIAAPIPIARGKFAETFELVTIASHNTKEANIPGSAENWRRRELTAGIAATVKKAKEGARNRADAPGQILLASAGKPSSGK